MGLYPTVIGDITLGPGINDIVVSGFGVVAGYPTVETTIIAHPSNSGVLYIRRRGGIGYGYPLAAGTAVTLANVDLYDYTASGVSGHRLAYVARR